MVAWALPIFFLKYLHDRVETSAVEEYTAVDYEQGVGRTGITTWKLMCSNLIKTSDECGDFMRLPQSFSGLTLSGKYNVCGME